MAGSLKVKWKAHPQLSAIHAAYIVATGRPCNDPRIEAELAPAVMDLNQRLLSASLDISAFWRRLTIEVAMDREIDSACEIAVAASGCSELQLDSMTGAVLNRVRECRSIVSGRFPKLGEQLPLRGRPLIERFDAYGPGLLRAVANFVWDKSPPKDFWPSRIDGLLIQPIRGGDGDYDADGGRIWVEAMLTDVDPRVPEYLRIVHLLTMAAMDLHTRVRSSENPATLPWTWGTVPIVLHVAADLELIRGNPLPIEAALQLWHLGDASTASTLAAWWDVQLASPAPLPVALKDLGRQLAAKNLRR